MEQRGTVLKTTKSPKRGLYSSTAFIILMSFKLTSPVNFRSTEVSHLQRKEHCEKVSCPPSEKKSVTEGQASREAEWLLVPQETTEPAK